MMGFAMINANFPVQKNTSGVLFMTAKEAPAYEENPCIGCGRCLRACPCSLTPVLMNRALTAGNIEEAKMFGLMDCVECGSCAWVCPAHVKLVQRFRVGKNIVRAEMAKAKAAAAQAQAAAAAKAAGGAAPAATSASGATGAQSANAASAQTAKGDK